MSYQDLDDDLELWTPPSEAEQKVIEARRDRIDKITRLMGPYLLKGYKMLDATCPTCSCILLEDRLKKKYCVGCSEVDNVDTIKDNPAVNELAARKTVEENQHRSSNQTVCDVDSQNSLPSSTVNNTTESLNHRIINQGCQTPHSADSCQISTTHTAQCNSKHQNNIRLGNKTIDLTTEIMEAIAVLQMKLRWSTEQLKESQGVHESKQFASLITETCNALLSLKNLLTEEKC